MTPASLRFQSIGHEVPRRPELLRFLTGKARFADDLDLPRMLHAVILRSPHAHARLARIDATQARAVSGVAAIFTAADLPAGLKPIPVRLNPYNTLDPYLQHPMARERVRYVGEPVALVVAQSRAIAEDAATLVEVEYESLPAVTNAESAIVPAVLHEAAPDNVSSRLSDGFGDVAAAFAMADEIVELQFRTGRDSAIPMETRGLVASFDPGTGHIEVWGAAKVVHFNRSVLASLLEIPEHRIRLVEGDVGGGFGARGEFYPEDFLIPYAALRLMRPVKWIEDRLEHLVAINHSRQQTYRMKLGVARDGTLLGVEVDLVNDMGAYLRTHGIIVPEMSAGFFPGPYRWGAYRYTVRCAMTNKTPTGTYRCPGRYECNTARERLIDVAAARLGMDPAELRRRNMIRSEAMPFKVGTRALGEEVIYDSGDYPAALEEALRISGYAQRGSQFAGADGYRIGWGLGCFVEKTGKGPFEGARVIIDPTGGVEVRTGASSLGQGLETSLAQIAAEVLGVPTQSVAVRHGDTDLIPFGVGSFASRGTVMAGNAVHQAALAVRDRVFRLAALRLDAQPQDLQLEGGQVRAPNGKAITLHEIAQGATPGSSDQLLDETCYFKCDHMAYSHGAVVARVRVDMRLGQVVPLHLWVVYDVGTVINPQLVAGQVEGGAAQALGGALFEEFIYDQEGQFLTGSFMDFLIPTADVVAPVTHLNLDRSPSPLNPLGVKGAGEAGVSGVGAAIANAVADALGVPGNACVDQLPMTPQRVWGWIDKAVYLGQDGANRQAYRGQDGLNETSR